LVPGGKNVLLIDYVPGGKMTRPKKSLQI
jgi:hypothetical protein